MYSRVSTYGHNEKEQNHRLSLFCGERHSGKNIDAEMLRKELCAS